MSCKKFLIKNKKQFSLQRYHTCAARFKPTYVIVALHHIHKKAIGYLKWKKCISTTIIDRNWLSVNHAEDHGFICCKASIYIYF